jgi:hypothetical protein
MPTCKSCGVEIIWRRSINSGKAMPIDADPADNGNVRLVGSAECEVVPRGDLEQARADGEVLRLSHFVTCPDAPTHRRR